MCLLIVSEKEFPSLEILRLGNEQNPHGAGIAWVEKGKVYWHKGLKLEELTQYEMKGPPWIIHFRLATHGPKTAELTHPFPVDLKCTTATSGTANAVLAHNGSWTNWSKELMTSLGGDIVLPKGMWSDTRAMAWLTAVKGEQFIQTLNEKVAILQADGEVKIVKPTAWHKQSETMLLSYDPFSRKSLIKVGHSLHANNLPACVNPTSSSNISHNDDWNSESCIMPSNYRASNIYESTKHFAGYKLPEPLDA